MKFFRQPKRKLTTSLVTTTWTTTANPESCPAAPEVNKHIFGSKINEKIIKTMTIASISTIFSKFDWTIQGDTLPRASKTGAAWPQSRRFTGVVGPSSACLARHHQRRVEGTFFQVTNFDRNAIRFSFFPLSNNLSNTKFWFCFRLVKWVAWTIRWAPSFLHQND